MTRSRHIKNVTDKAFEFFKKHGFTRLIVGTSEEKLRPRIMDHLHSYLRRRIAGEIDARPEEHKDTLEEKALQAAQTFERKEEKKKVDRLLELHNAGDKATLGIEPTLEALMLG